MFSIIRSAPRSSTNAIASVSRGTMMTPQQQYQILVQSLRLVAAPKDQQIAALPSFVFPTDEVATSFGDAFLLVSQLAEGGFITREAVEALTDLDRWFSSMPKDGSVAEVDSLESHNFWQTARELASNALAKLGEEKSPLDLSHIYWTQ